MTTFEVIAWSWPTLLLFGVYTLATGYVIVKIMKGDILS
jgi:hypothetical protein